MNKYIDLTKILKDCPKGTKLYSPIFGDIYFKKILSGYKLSILVENGAYNASFTKEGFYYDNANGECLLFPSKEQRDWSKFTAPWYNKEKFNPNTLHPFDKVLVRDNYNQTWRCDILSHILNKSYDFKYVTIVSAYKYCIPYNDDTKHLIGTTEEAPEYYRYWEK